MKTLVLLHRLQILLCLLICLLLSACATGTVTAYRDGASVVQQSTAETRLWDQAANFDVEIAKTDQINPDPKLQAYLQTVMDKIYPEFRGQLRVQILKAPVLNAFALPNGSVYIHQSLVARCDNEAQLATILAHEGAHFVGRHSVNQINNAKASSAFANVLSLAGIPLIGPLIAISSISGYSQELEIEADKLAFERLVQVGYDPAETVIIFQRMADEAKALDQDDPIFFSSHPRMKERVESFQTMLAKQPSPGGERGAEVFRAMISSLKVDSLEEDLSMNRAACVILALEGEEEPVGYPVHYQYYLGEAYRLRGDEGDVEKALAAYRCAIDAAPDFPDSYRALGFYYLKAKETDKARSYLQRYLDYEQDEAERTYVDFYLSKLQN